MGEKFDEGKIQGTRVVGTKIWCVWRWHRNVARGRKAVAFIFISG